MDELNMALAVCEEMIEELRHKGEQVKDSLEGNSEEQKQRLTGAVWAYGQALVHVLALKGRYMAEKMRLEMKM